MVRFLFLRGGAALGATRFSRFWEARGGSGGAGGRRRAGAGRSPGAGPSCVHWQLPRRGGAPAFVVE